MSQLSQALQEFETQLRRVSPHTAGQLAPGLAEEEIRTALLELGLDAPEEILEWFARHNGRTILSGSRAWLAPIGPSVLAAPLDACVEQFRWWRDFVTENYPPSHDEDLTWFPVIATSHGGWVVVKCTGTDGPARCTMQHNGGERMPNTLTLDECITMWTHAISTGIWTCSEDEAGTPDWTSHSHRTSAPLELKLTGLAP